MQGITPMADNDVVYSSGFYINVVATQEICFIKHTGCMKQEDNMHHLILIRYNFSY